MNSGPQLDPPNAFAVAWECWAYLLWNASDRRRTGAVGRARFPVRGLRDLAGSLYVLRGSIFWSRPGTPTLGRVAASEKPAPKAGITWENTTVTIRMCRLHFSGNQASQWFVNCREVELKMFTGPRLRFGYDTRSSRTSILSTKGRLPFSATAAKLNVICFK